MQGKTVAVLGTSGVGKSTLVNFLENTLGDYSLVDADQAYVSSGVDNLPENIKHHNQYLLATAPTGGYQTYSIYGGASRRVSRNPRGYYKI